MSYAIDANILLYAANASSSFNERAVSFIEQCANRGEVLCLAWPTVMAFLRISTHPGIFPRPLSMKEAMKYVDALLDLPHTRTISAREGFWDVYRQVAEAVVLRGNLVPDAHLAAILKQNGVMVLYTNDLDFRKFEFLKVSNPLREPS